MTPLTPEEIDRLELGQIPGVLALLNNAQMRLIERLAIAQPSSRPSPTADADDVMLTVREAAAILRKSTKWIYRHRDLPFIRKVGGGLLISKRGLERWLERQRPHC